MRDKRAWLRRRADGIRRAIVLEPRGHADMVAAVLTEAGFSRSARRDSVHGRHVDYPSISGHGIIAAATIAVARELFVSARRARR